jgi:hypothetical protein
MSYIYSNILKTGIDTHYFLKFLRWGHEYDFGRFVDFNDLSIDLEGAFRDFSEDSDNFVVDNEEYTPCEEHYGFYDLDSMLSYHKNKKEFNVFYTKVLKTIYDIAVEFFKPNEIPKIWHDYFKKSDPVVSEKHIYL